MSRSHIGENNPRSRLTEVVVRAIREGYSVGTSVVMLSALYGISEIMVYKILSGERWGHVKG